MRLLRTDTTLKLDWVNDENYPKYAALSHTWGPDELKYSDIISGGSIRVLPENFRDKKGFQKVARLAELASSDGYDFCWIDTVCIDDGSSAELGEALNSMYRWYYNAAVCYIFLDDFEWEQTTPNSNSASQACLSPSRFKSCRWFKRGWTLQELIASRNRKFYDKNGFDIGSAAKEIGIDLDRIIEEQTGIELAILRHEKSPKDVNVATRMRWAAGRETTRGEDIAWCLVGIFDIHMPMSYGEGRKKAFRRLQEEILKTSSDESIFAWQSNHPARLKLGLLAESPDQFYDCR
ncbi:HET-domain-containing protein, partial [Hyaloscypha hepaticicola]